MGYDITRFVNNKGYNRFRSVTVLKNSYGVDDIRVGFQFVGEVGAFRELPRAKDMTDDDYNKAANLTNGVTKN
jgi:hypothetical protein